MKGKFIFVFFFLIQLRLVPQSFPWAVSVTGSSIDEGIAVANDPTGNVYITGQFTSSLVAFGSNTLTNSSGSSVFLAKYNSSGNPIWARKGICSAQDYGNSVTCDGAGNIYISGFFQSPSIVFGNYTLTNNGNYDIFIAKYDSNGNVLWAQGAGDAGNDYGYSVRADAAGNVYLAGSFASSTISFGTYTLTNSGVCDSYLVKYNSAGVVQWARNPTGSGGDENWSACPDANGNVYVVGDFVSPNLVFGTFTLTNTGSCPLYLAKYNANGNVVWVQKAGGSGFDFCNWVTVDANGDPIITGDFSSSNIVFGTYTLTNNGVNDAYIVKYNSAGNVVWAKSAGNAGINKGFCVSADNSNIYCTGSFTGGIVFGSNTLTAQAGASDPVYIVTYDYNGNVVCASYLNSGSDDQQGISADKLGNAYFTSDFIGTLAVGNTTLTPTGSENIFLAKYVCQDLTGLDEQKIETVKVFPNPVSKQLNIHFSKESERIFFLFDQCGKLLTKKNIAGKEAKILIEGFEEGFYFYKITESENEKNAGMGKLIIQSN